MSLSLSEEPQLWRGDPWEALVTFASRLGKIPAVRLVIARCSVDYEGRLQAHLPLATRLLVVKADGSVLVHSDGGSYKPLNWMSPPCAMAEVDPEQDEIAEGVESIWVVQHAKSDAVSYTHLTLPTILRV